MQNKSVAEISEQSLTKLKRNFIFGRIVRIRSSLILSLDVKRFFAVTSSLGFKPAAFPLYYMIGTRRFTTQLF